MNTARIECGNCHGTGCVRFTYANGVCFACKGHGKVNAGIKRNDPAWYSDRAAVIAKCNTILNDMVAHHKDPSRDDSSTYDIANMWRVSPNDVRDRWLSAVATKLPKRLAWFKHMAGIAE